MKWVHERLIARFVLCMSPSIPSTCSYSLFSKRPITSLKHHLHTSRAALSSPLLFILLAYYFTTFWFKSKGKKELNGSIYNLLTAIKTWELGSILSAPQSKGIQQNFKHLAARPMAPQAARKDLCGRMLLQLQGYQVVWNKPVPGNLKSKIRKQ